MTELIKGLIQIRDALSLIAFLSLVLLFAFRTKQVPELFFELLRDKLTRQQFSVLLGRFMTIGLVAFLALVILAILAQVLNHLTQPSALSLNDLRNELAKIHGDEARKIHAEAEYRVAMEKLNLRDLDGAIAALQRSVNAIPTLTAQEMLTYLYRQKGNPESEAAAWEQAVNTAQKSGDKLAMIRLDRISVPRAVPSPDGEHDLIGASVPLPVGGDKYEHAVRIEPGFYNCTVAKQWDTCFWWYTIYLKAGQTLDVKFRSPAPGGLAGIAFFGTNGQSLAGGAGDGADTMRGNAGPAATIYKAALTAPDSGWYFIRPVADSGTVYRFQIQ